MSDKVRQMEAQLVKTNKDLKGIDAASLSARITTLENAKHTHSNSTVLVLLTQEHIDLLEDLSQTNVTVLSDITAEHITLLNTILTEKIALLNRLDTDTNNKLTLDGVLV